MFWQPELQKKKKKRETQREREGSASAVHTWMYTHSNTPTQNTHTHKNIKMRSHTLAFPVNHKHTHHHSLTHYVLRASSPHTHSKHSNRSQYTMLTSHFALQLHLSLAQLSNSRTLLFALFYPLPLFLLNNPPHTHIHTRLHHIHYTSFPSKSLSFLLLITVVGPFELFKAVRAARKTPSAPKRDDLSAERQSERARGGDGERERA